MLEFLERQYNLNRLSQSYLINTENIAQTYEQLQAFLCKILDTTKLEGCGEYKLIKRKDSTSKNIAIDQIRELQEFLSKTSVISGKKVAVIYAADEMNVNSMNSCLKLLEEPPFGTYIFLLTENSSSLLPTILSRCNTINHINCPQPKQHWQFVDILVGNKILERQEFIEKMNKNRELWHEFTDEIENLLAKLAKSLAKVLDQNELTATEQQLLKRYQGNFWLFNVECDKVKEIIANTKEYDLDLRASTALIISTFT